MINNLDDESRALLDLARDARNPSDDDRGRVRAALASRLGSAAGLGLAAGVAATGLASVAKAAAATGAGATAKALGAGAAVVKLVGAVVVVSATLGVGTVVVYHARRAPVVTVSVCREGGPTWPASSILDDDGGAARDACARE